MIGVVPASSRARGRRVYPGFLQLSRVHEHERRAPRQIVRRPVQASRRRRLREGRRDPEFYKEYFAIMDMSADFYLETVEQVFQRCLLPQGQMKFKGRDDRAARDQEDLPADGRGREGRYLRGRPDAGGAGPVRRPAALYEDPPPAGRRRPLRRVQRPPLGGAGLSRWCATTSRRAADASGVGVKPGFSHFKGLRELQSFSAQGGHRGQG